LAAGLQEEAASHMRDAVFVIQRTKGDVGGADAVARHWGSLRTAVGLLNAIPLPTPMSLADAEESVDVDVSSLAAFANTWQNWVKNLACGTLREREQFRITLEISRAKRIHGDGFEEEVARRRAEESPAWCERFLLAEGKAKCVRGMEQVRRRTDAGVISSDKMVEIMAKKTEELHFRESALAEHMRSTAFNEALTAIENYARWYHGSGIAALQEERQSLSCHVPSVSGKFLEDVAIRWLEHEAAMLPPLQSGHQRKVLRNVCFRGVSMPEAVASEFDAFVVVCKPCDSSARPPKQAGDAESLLQVVALERWVEVKNNPDEVLEAWCRHREARMVLAAHTGYIGFDAGSDGRFWFPAQVFGDLLVV